MSKNEIGINAGVIWNLLLENGRMSVTEIAERTNYEDKYTSLAIGWLAKEGKIDLMDTERGLLVELNHSAGEYYY